MNLHASELIKLSKVLSLGLVIGCLGIARLSFKIHVIFWIPTLILAGLAFVDLSFRYGQKRHSILRNFGVFGWARYLMESIGPELRQYWIASDTEERPFTRRQRSEIYQIAKDEHVQSESFGTTVEKLEGTIRHSFFPVSKSDLIPYSLTFGEERGCPTPYTITKPFMASAMSFGALGEHAVRALTRGARAAGIPVNTGEGGYLMHAEEGADLIFQLGTAKFGARHEDGTLDEDKLREAAAHDCIKMIEIKFSQGAKPGKGGLLPGDKVTAQIAQIRGLPVGKDVHSPPRHAECDTIENTVEFIGRVQQITGIPVGIKFCLGSGDELRSLIRAMKSANSFPDYIALDGSEGGTGAAPRAFMDYVGIPLFPALSIVTGILKEEKVRDRFKLITAGKLISPGMQIRAFAYGADAIYTARGFMLALGCIQALQCNTGSCPVGITTHDPFLQRGLDIQEKSERVHNYVKNMEYMLKELLSATGKREFRDLSRDNLFPAETESAAADNVQAL